MTTWLQRLRGVPEYVETYGDPLNRITHAERTGERIDVFEAHFSEEYDLPHREDAADLWTSGRYNARNPFTQAALDK